MPTTSVIIDRYPEGNIGTGQLVNFFVTSGNTSYSTYKWYLISGSTKTLISTESGCTVLFSDSGSFSVDLELNNYPESWTGGHFYGGDFEGFFGGGTFNYGTLNDYDIINQNVNNKIFIEKSN